MVAVMSPPEIAGPVVCSKGGEGVGNRFVQRPCRHVERVLGLVRVMDDDGAALGRHERNLTYSLVFRLSQSALVACSPNYFSNNATDVRAVDSSS